MIKKLQRKFVMISMGSLALVMVVIIGVMNAVNMVQLNQRADGLLQILSENDGKFPEMEKDKDKDRERPPMPAPGFGLKLTAETRFETRYFTVCLDQAETVAWIDTGHIAAVSSSQAEEYAAQVLEKHRKAGYYGFYKYRVSEQDGQKLVIFVDCHSQIQTALSFLIVSSGVALAAFLVVLVLVSVFSKRAIKPVAESMEKQKQFIANAGHEIKTPLAIISANTEVLELCCGGNEWLESIRNQTRRLDCLVKNLLTLSRLEDEKMALPVAPFLLSDTVFETAAAFETLAASQGKRFALCIEPGIVKNGNQESIRELVSILVDNAVKYTDEHGEIRVSLQREGKTARLDVYNTCQEAPAGDLGKLFDRFYRADTSRSRESGGYGIGLSIARAIVQAHHGTIAARNADGKSMCFTVVL